MTRVKGDPHSHSSGWQAKDAFGDVVVVVDKKPELMNKPSYVLTPYLTHCTGVVSLIRIITLSLGQQRSSRMIFGEGAHFGSGLCVGEQGARAPSTPTTVHSLVCVHGFFTSPSCLPVVANSGPRDTRHTPGTRTNTQRTAWLILSVPEGGRQKAEREEKERRCSSSLL